LPVFRPTEFLQPDDPNEATQKLRSEGKRAHIIAGGTGFYELARRGYIPEVNSVVSIMRLGLDYINEQENEVAIGATTTLQKLLESGIGDRPGIEAVGDALREIRPVQIRNVATIGGEVCISVPVVDLPTALLACEAHVKILGADGEYCMNLDEFYIDAFLTKLRYGEIVKQVDIRKGRGNGTSSHSAFVKLGRTAYDFNLVNCAVMLNCDPKSKKVDSIRAYLGGIKRAPLRAAVFERKIVGKVPDQEVIFEAARNSFSKSNFLPSVHGSSEYKREVLPIVLRDCIMKAFERTLADQSVRT